MPTDPARAPLIIHNGLIDIGVDQTRFAADHVDGLLRSYLLLLRRARVQRRAASITLRRDDIEVIAGYLDTTAETVLERLADLMGSTRTQRAAMLTVFATGAMLIAATGSVAADSPRPPVHGIVSGPTAATVAEAATDPDTIDAVLATPPTISHEGAGQAGSHSNSAAAERSGAAHNEIADDGSTAATGSLAVPTLPDKIGVIEGETGVTDDRSTAAPRRRYKLTETAPGPHHNLTETAPQPNETGVTETAPHPNETGVADDGSIVAVGLPPVPAPPDQLPPPPPSSHATAAQHHNLTQTAPQPNDTGVADDGSIVAVGLPPVPSPPVQTNQPTRPPGNDTAAHHNLTQTAPQPNDTGVTDDGSIVAVGLPPVPVPPGGD